jgi:adenylylsulfate kinase-like enzyme
MSSVVNEETAGKTSPIILIVMGVSGSGKTTVAAMLAGRLHWRFQEGDALHPQANVDKMRHGIPLTDADRLPWLDSIAALVDRWSAEGVSGIITCSALKRAYRERIRAGRPAVELIYLHGARTGVGADNPANGPFHASEPSRQPVCDPGGARRRRTGDHGRHRRFAR